jgi:hypothetical protein
VWRAGELFFLKQACNFAVVSPELNDRRISGRRQPTTWRTLLCSQSVLDPCPRPVATSRHLLDMDLARSPQVEDRDHLELVDLRDSPDRIALLRFETRRQVELFLRARA